MRLVLIADEGPVNAWLIREVERQQPIRAIIRPDWNVARPPGSAAPTPVVTRTVATVTATTRLVSRLRRRFFAVTDRGVPAQLERILFADGQLPVPTAAVITVPAWQINTVLTQVTIRAFDPDMIVVSGAPLPIPAIFDLPRLGTVNLHFGISPDYRGMHALITPWQAGDYAHVGATLHHVTEGIDDGAVLFRVYPELTPDDDPISAEAKIVRLSARVLCDLLHRLSARDAATCEPGRRFAASGRLVRFNDRSIRAHLQYRLRRMAGARAPAQPARIETFYDDIA